MMDYLVFSFWAFLAWYLPKLEGSRRVEGVVTGPERAVGNLDQVYFQLGLVHESLAQHMRAVVNYKEAARINPRMEKAHFGIGKNYVLAQRLEKAIKPLEKAHKLNPEETLTAIYLGWANSQLGEHEKAAAIFKKALNYNAMCPSCGIKHHKNEEMAASAVVKISSAQHAGELNNDAQEAKIAQSTAGVGNLSLGGNAPVLSMKPANDKVDGGKEDNKSPASSADGKGLKIEFQGIDLVDARLAVTLYRYGLAHIKMEEYFPAMVELCEAVRLDPEFSDAHYALGLVYERMGMQKESVAEYILALKDKPAFHEAKFKLEEEVTLDELKRLLPDHFSKEDAPPPKRHHHKYPSNVVPLKPPESFRETVKEQGLGKALKKQIGRWY